MQQVQAVTFDVGGTLLDVDPSVGAVYARCLAAYGIRADMSTIDSRFPVAFKAAYAHGHHMCSDTAASAFWAFIVRQCLAGLGGLECNFDVLFRALMEAFTHREHWRVIEDPCPVFHALKQRGLRVAFFSNFDSRIHPLMEELGWASNVDAICVSTELGVEKPALDAFAKTASRLACPPAAILHVGDSRKNDFEGALRAGWQARLFEKGAKPDDTHIGSLHEILHLV